MRRRRRRQPQRHRPRSTTKKSEATQNKQQWKKRIEKMENVLLSFRPCPFSNVLHSSAEEPVDKSACRSMPAIATIDRRTAASQRNWVRNVMEFRTRQTEPTISSIFCAFDASFSLLFCIYICRRFGKTQPFPIESTQFSQTIFIVSRLLATPSIRRKCSPHFSCLGKCAQVDWPIKLQS